MAGKLIIGVGDIGLIKGENEIIKTLGLGSCVAVVLLDPATKSIGMAHIALPDSSVNPEKIATKPGYFADTGVIALIDLMKRSGCNSLHSNYVVKLVGGARISDKNGRFNIGARNVIAIKKILWQLGMGPISEDVAGDKSRSVAAETNTGRVSIITPGFPVKDI